MKKFAILAITSLFLLTACASGPEKAVVEDTIQKAEAANDQAKKLGFEWRDVRWKKSKKKYLTKAKAALKDGDNAKAYKLAKKSLEMGEMAIQQAKDQVNAGPAF